MGAHRHRSPREAPGAPVARPTSVASVAAPALAPTPREHLFQLLTEFSRDMISCHDAAGRVLYVSPACEPLLGYAPAELLGVLGDSIVHPEDSARVWKAIRDHEGRRDDYYDVKFRMRRKNGAFVWVETRGRLLFDASTGALSQIHCHTRDITEFHAVQDSLHAANSRLQRCVLERSEQLQQTIAKLDSEIGARAAAQRLITEYRETLLQKERLAQIGELVASGAHCMKNVLTILRGSDSMLEHALRDRDWGAVEQTQALLHRAVSNLYLILMDTLDLSKDREPLREHVSLPELFAAITKSFARTFRALGVQCEVHVEADAQTVYLDCPRLERCLLDLVSNSLDAMPCGGRLSLRAYRMPADATPGTTCQRLAARRPDAPRCRDLVIIEVADTGTGIPDHVLTRVLDPFFSTKGSQGTGIGLATVHRFVTDHDGVIDVETGPAAGTRFLLGFPAD